MGVERCDFSSDDDFRYAQQQEYDEYMEEQRMQDYISECAEDDYRKELISNIPTERLSEICAAEQEGRCVILPQKDDMGSVSDGYHTFDELYDQRAILFSVICRTFPDKAWKSKLHSDGTMFEGGYFIVGITTPQGDYTYHYGLKKWDWFPVREIDNAPEWDGHTDKDVTRLYSLLAKEQAESKLAEMKGGE